MAAASALAKPRTSRPPPVFEPQDFDPQWGPAPLRVRPAELRLGSLLRERLRQVVARADPELAVGARQVHLDRLERDVERLGDLLVGPARGGEVGHAALARRERARSRLLRLARPGAARVQLGARAL